MKTRDSNPSFPIDMAFLLLPLQVTILVMIGHLRGWQWILAYAAAIMIVGTGGALILKAKLPLYREKRFLSFGVRTLPSSSIPVYYRGWRWVISGTILGVWLLITRG